MSHLTANRPADRDRGRGDVDPPSPLTSAVTPSVVPVAGLVHARPGMIRRLPADFAGSTVRTLKAGWGPLLIGSSPWAKLLDAVNTYAALAPDDYQKQARVLATLPALIQDWETHHQAGTKAPSADEQAKINAIAQLRQLIDIEHQLDPATQRGLAPRFRDDFLLDRLAQGLLTLTSGDRGLHVTRVQQALADAGRLLPGRVGGVIDASTVAAVKGLQRTLGRTDTGVLDGPVLAALSGFYRGHRAEATLATNAAAPVRVAHGQYAFGTAPVGLGAGTRELTGQESAAARGAISTAQLAGAAGQLPTFVSALPAGTYEARLKALVLLHVDAQYDQIARGKAGKRGPTDLFGWPHIKAVAKRSKQVTDAVFGKYTIGPPLRPGVSIHDAWEAKVATLSVTKAADDAAIWRVNKLLTGEGQVKALDREHGAIQTRGPEKAIVDRVRGEIVAARRDDLLEIHKAWPAFAGGGVVNIQRFKANDVPGNRDAMWDLFQTVVHEYLHTLEHTRYRAYRESLGQQAGGFTLREGVVEYFTYTVLESVTYDDALRTLVEGEFHDDTVVHPIPAYHGYGERINAEKLAGVVGARNVMAAFFLGDVDKIGATA